MQMIINFLACFSPLFIVVIFENAGAVNISARSMGEVNVQIIMESLGGGRPVMLFDDTEPTENEIVIGRTARETQCGVSFERGASSAEYELRFVDSRLYITGLGVIPEQNPDPTATTDFGDIGTIFADIFLDVVLEDIYCQLSALIVGVRRTVCNCCLEVSGVG